MKFLSMLVIYAYTIERLTTTSIVIVAKQTFLNVGVLPHAKKLFPFTMQGQQAYAKFKAPIETGLQTKIGALVLLGMLA